MESNITAAEQSEIVQLVCFRLAGEEYAVDITNVQEVIRVQSITPVPRMPVFVLGVINIRGNIVPVFDLRKEFNLPQKTSDEHTKFLVLNIKGVLSSIVVDKILDNIKIPVSHIDPAPGVKLNIDRECIKGLGQVSGRMIIILDLLKLSEIISKRIESFGEGV